MLSQSGVFDAAVEYSELLSPRSPSPGASSLRSLRRSLCVLFLSLDPTYTNTPNRTTKPHPTHAQSPDVSPHQTPLHNSATLSSKLLLLSRGWGTSSTSLSLSACLAPPSASFPSLPDDPNTLRFDFYAEKGTAHSVVMTPEELRELGDTEKVYR